MKTGEFEVIVALRQGSDLTRPTVVYRSGGNDQ